MSDLPTKQLSTKLASGEIVSIKLGGTTAGDSVLNQDSMDARYQDLLGASAIVKTKYTPQSSAPAYVEGQEYYDSIENVKKIQGPIEGVEVKVGHDLHIHIENNSGGVIEKGMAVRVDGVVDGIIQVVKAKADTLTNASILGAAAHEIADGTEGIVLAWGILEGTDTDGLDVGVPMYLSDTVAGTYSAARPAIASRIGGVVVSDATDGVLRVNIVNLTNPPSLFGGMQGQTSGDETYSLTTTEQDIINYKTSNTTVVAVDKLTGEVTIPNTGEYRMHFTASISFTSVTQTRNVTIELYDVTGALIHFPYVKNIPRDATDDSLSFSWPIDETAGNVHKMRIKASTTMDVTFNEISFDIQSVSIV